MKQRNAQLIKKVSRYRVILIASMIGVTLLAILLIRLMPASKKDIRKSVCFVDGMTQLCLVSGQDTIVLQSDTICQQGAWINRHWWWPSCDGSILTVGRACAPTPRRQWPDANDLPRQMSEIIDSIGRLLTIKDTEQQEIEYYIRSHGVQDEGYNRISRYANLQKKATDSLRSVYQTLKSIKLDQHSHFVRKYFLQASWYNADGRLDTMECQPILSYTNHSEDTITIHTKQNLTPRGVYAVKRMPWGAAGSKRIVTATLTRKDSISRHHTLLANGKMIDETHHDLPDLFARDGSPVFTAYGLFVGIISKQTVKQ
ncbi:MAG: hypothetical protein ACOYJK_00340 [Prevotella sp.]|jgi:hypothetical protein